MCGIAGQVNFGEPPTSAGVATIVDQLRHRGPDNSGLWSSPHGECVLGHTRLSILDLSPLGHQPMSDPATGNCIVFNGEIYNFQSLRDECKIKGDAFRSSSDTEVILTLYRRHGLDCISKLRGMFSFALWDERERRLFLVRDRLGKKPLNYALTSDGIVFCSEISPLVRHRAVSKTMDVRALELYLQLQYIPAPCTIYEGVRKLPAGHYAVVTTTGVKIERYWELDYTNKIKISESEAISELEDKLTTAVRLRMISDVPIGALLSGGVDSSLIVALMAKLNGSTRTYSIGFRDEKFNELGYARQAAEICGTTHHPETIEGNMGQMLPMLVRHYGEPYADSSALPSFLVCQAARAHVKVVLNGDGGDELLGGYPRYRLSALQMLLSGLVQSIPPPGGLSTLASRFTNTKTLPSKALSRFVMGYLWPELRSIVMYGGFWSADDRFRLLGDAGPGSHVLAEWHADWFTQARTHAHNPVESMLWYDNKTYLPGDLLVKMDIASMHCGLETRSPLLDHNLVEYCASLPVELKVKNGVSKYLLKRLAERFFPEAFVHRPKMGFGIPLDRWLRGPLRAALESIVRDPDAMAPLQPQVIREKLGEFLRGEGNHSSRMWALFMYGMWRKHEFGLLS